MGFRSTIPPSKQRLVQATLLLLGVLCLLKVSAASASSEGPIEFFSKLREENTKQLIALDKSIDQKLVQANTLESVSHFETEVQDLQSKKSEYQHRQDFLNRIILQFDTKFRGGDLQNFLSVAFKEMALVAAKSDDSSKVLWKFLNYMSVSVGALPKGHMDVLKFVEGYMNTGSVKDPVDPKQFLSQLDYYNDSQAQKANGITPAEAAELVESQNLAPL